MTIWPCDHGNVLVEPGFIRSGYRCHQCGSAPGHFVPASRLTEAEQRIEELAERMGGLIEAVGGLGIEGEAGDVEEFDAAMDEARAALGSTEEREP